MEAQSKIQSYFSTHPSLNMPLQHDQPYISDLVREAFGDKSLSFFYEELDIMEENFFDEKMEEVFESYSLSREPPFSMKEFMLFFVRQDRKIKVKYQEYEVMNEKARLFLNQVEKEKISEIEDKQESKQREWRQQSKSQPKLTVDPDPDETEVESELLNISASPSNSTFKKSLFSPRPFDNIVIVKKRLKNLFNIYNRKHYTNKTSLTFDEIPTQVATFNLNVWMLFNRDFGFIKELGKNNVLAVFKKYSDKQLMGFELFEVALYQIFKKVYPNDRNEGWRTLCIETDQSYHQKLKELGVPYLDETQIVQPQSYDSPGPRRVFEDRTQNIVSNFKALTKTPSVKKSKMDPFAKIHLSNPISVDADQQDRIFMREYRLNNKNNKYVVNHQQKRIIQESPSSGLLKRLDDRIKKYANS